MEGGTRGVQVLMSGEIQAMHVGLAPVVQANKQGADLRLVTSTGNTIPITIFGTAAIKSMPELKGKTIGISTFGSETDIAISIALKNAGLSRKDVTISQIGGSSQRFASLSAGRIDAAPLLEPGITMAKEKGFNPLVDLAAAKTPWIFDSVVVTNSYLKGQRDTLTRFVRGYIAGAYLALSDEKKAKEVIAQKFKTSDPKVIDATYADFKRMMPRDAAPSPDGAKNVHRAIGGDRHRGRQQERRRLSRSGHHPEAQAGWLFRAARKDLSHQIARKVVPLNAIDLEVIYQSTLQIARELTLNMLRTGYSTIIKESQDFTFAIFDAQGRMVAQGIPQPLHIGPLNAQVNEIRRRFRDDTEPGDAFIVNHPYQACQNHATDVTVISPVFVRGRIAAYIGNIAHKPDLGGKVPGTNSGDATDLFQEGLLIPPTKILRRGKMNVDVQNMICANTRTPEVTWGDIRAQVNTNTYGISKFTELFDKHGVATVQACWQRWMDICETELRKEIAKVPDGRYGPETDYLDDDGVELAKPHRISASLEVKGDTLHFILDSDAQARGPINLRPCVSRNFIECLVKMIFIPQLPVNAGLSRPVKVLLSAGRLAAQSAVSGAGQYVRAAEPDHDLGGDAHPGAGRAGPRAGARAAPPAARSAAPGAIRFPDAGIRNTRS